MVDIVWVLSVVIEYDLGSKKSFGNCRCGSSGISISGDGNETEMVLRIYFVTRYFAGFPFVDGFPRDVRPFNCSIIVFVVKGCGSWPVHQFIGIVVHN